MRVEVAVRERDAAATMAPASQAEEGADGGDGVRARWVAAKRKARLWLIPVLATGLALSLQQQIVELPSRIAGMIRDSGSDAASGPDFAAAVEVVRVDDEDGFSAATSGDFRPSAAQSRFLAQPMSSASKKFDGLLRSTGAVNVGKQTLRLVLIGLRDQQVNILDIHPVIVRRASPLAGTLFAVGAQAGSPTFQIVYDLDRPYPVAHKAVLDEHTSELEPGPPFFAGTTITLHRDEQNVVVLRATTRRFYAAFRLDVTYMLGNRRMHKVIDDHGRPFQVTGVSRGPDGKDRYRRVFTAQSDYSMCQTVGPGADPARQCEGG